MTDWINKVAMNLADVTPTDSCNKTAYKVGKKSFLFLGIKEDSYNVMVKLADSLDDATALAQSLPNNYSVGKHGWTTLKFDNDEDGPDEQVLTRWIEESYQLFAK